MMMRVRTGRAAAFGAAFAALLLIPGAVAAQGRGGSVRIEPGESCPAGMTEIRPQLCRAPQIEPPSIVDYRPRSMLVTEEHQVPRARFPVVDVHGHARGLAEPGAIEEMVGALDSLNIGVYISADNRTGERLRRTLEAIHASPHRDRFRVLAGIDFGDLEPGWGERAARQLEADIEAGAIGVGEISKSFGMRIRKPDGTRLRVDDPELDPVWETLARLDVPAFIHTAEPPAFFEPLDYENERWLELALFPRRRNHGPEYVSFEQLIEERDNLFRRHPNTTFVAAHFGWHAHDLERAARMLDEFPNVLVEVGAILYDLGRQPRAAREFFIEYRDRILFGKDSFQPSEYPYYWRVFETADEYFDYYRDYHAYWKLYGMDLPDDVLRELYYENALRIFSGLPRDGWPAPATASAPPGAQAEEVDLRITLERDSERERATADQLRRTLEEYDVAPWIFTRHVHIRARSIPHSHPVLTLHTRHLGNEHGLLATFLHEQFHWLEEGNDDFRAAMDAYAEAYPNAPAGGPEGARDLESTYRHLLVCDLEFQAMSLLVGEERAREVLSANGHYTWIYDRVLNDPNVRRIAAAHGFVIDGSGGLRER